jgi:hypothetical protein
MKMLDQFLLSRGLLYGRQARCTDVGVPEVEIFRLGIMSNRKWRPREFQREGHSGYSDHFPNTTTLDFHPRRV